MSVAANLQSVIDSLQAALADAEKFDKGNASAGTRVRKAAQEGKKALHDLRTTVQEIKNTRAE